jgi:hypothetical protein
MKHAMRSLLVVAGTVAAVSAITAAPSSAGVTPDQLTQAGVGAAGIPGPELSITDFAAEPVPSEIRPSYWADDGRYITMGSAAWTTRPQVRYFFCLNNVTAPVGLHGYDRTGCISVYSDRFVWTFDPYTFPNDVGGVDGGFYYGELIEFYVVAFGPGLSGRAPSMRSNSVYEWIR